MNQNDVYMYGMNVVSSIYLLAGQYPAADTYQEIKTSYQLPGGETFNAAIVLSKLGLNVKIDGPYTGHKTNDILLDFGLRYGIDTSLFHYDPQFDGIQDLVLVDNETRTVFGQFIKHLFGGEKKWNKPDRTAIDAASIISIDPFFGNESELAASIAVELGKPYVTIDCPPESDIFKSAHATVISNEFIQREYKELPVEDLFKRYTDVGTGLVVFTFGSKEIMYGRSADEIHKLQPFKVDVVNTLGAGDTFRAGLIYGLLNGFDDHAMVKFSAAVAASVCTRFPMALNPPSLDEINAIMG